MSYAHITRAAGFSRRVVSLLTGLISLVFLVSAIAASSAHAQPPPDWEPPEPPPAQTYYGKPAISAGPLMNYIGQGIRMNTRVTLSRGGYQPGADRPLNGVTRTYSNWWGVGGHGTVGVILRDVHGNAIYASNVHRYGVDGKAIFWNRHDRTDSWNDMVPAVIAEHTEGLEILHTSASVDNFWNILREIREKGCALFNLVGQDCPLKG